MKVLITGGCGFLGQMIARAILAKGELRGPDGKPAEVECNTKQVKGLVLRTEFLKKA